MVDDRELPGPLAVQMSKVCRDLGIRGKVLVGVSGGSDSTALLLLLHEASSSGRIPMEVEVAHLHHGLRGAEADGDLDFVHDLASDLGLPFHGAREDVAAHSRRAGIGIEEGGRRARYEFFGRIAARTGAPFVATGHTLDDQAETVLHRILRGTGINGLSAIHRVRTLSGKTGIRVVRPLLLTSRNVLLDYLEKRGRAHRTDRTNSDLAYTRNRLRATLLPALRRVDPTIDRTLAGLARDALDLQNALEAYRLSRPSPGFLRLPEGILVPPPPLRAGHLEGASVFRRAFSSAGGEPGRLTRAHIRSLEAAWAGTGKRAVTLPGGVQARKTPQGLLFFAPGDGEDPLLHTVDLPLGREIRFGEWIVAAKSGPLPPPDALVGAADGETEHIDRDSLKFPLQIRGRRPGDRFHPLGGPGTMRLKEFFRASGIPGPARTRVPLVEDASGRLVWVVGLRIAHWARILPGTERAVRLTAKWQGPGVDSLDSGP
ncbi:MAG: tRNA lysidine(34) synthetase TilS [Planctomycetota bacterium]